MPKHYAQQGKTRLDDKVNWPTDEHDPETGEDDCLAKDPPQRQSDEPPHS